MLPRDVYITYVLTHIQQDISSSYGSSTTELHEPAGMDSQAGVTEDIFNGAITCLLPFSILPNIPTICLS